MGQSGHCAKPDGYLRLREFGSAMCPKICIPKDGFLVPYWYGRPKWSKDNGDRMLSLRFDVKFAAQGNIETLLLQIQMNHVYVRPKPTGILETFKKIVNNVIVPSANKMRVWNGSHIIYIPLTKNNNKF